MSSTTKKTGKVKTRERWPAPCVADGEFILLPKALIKRFGRIGMEPRHLWLILALQVDRYSDRAPRFYWEELALWCGRSKNTVRKWAYELEEAGLLNIRRTRKPGPDEHRRPGYRNERNTFLLDRFEDRLEREQVAWQKERRARPTRPRNTSESSDERQETTA